MTSTLKVQTYAVFMTVALAAYGLAKGGLLGLCTGVVVGLGVTGGVTIAFAAKESGIKDPRSRSGRIRRMSGLVSIFAMVIAGYLGGWKWGWATGLIVFVSVAAVTAVMATLVKDTSAQGDEPEP